MREQSGQTSWKRQISWFEPHPDVFQRLSLEANGDGRPDKTRSGTAPPTRFGSGVRPAVARALVARWAAAGFSALLLGSFGSLCSPLQW
ncbi:MAG TPA: hypothetical protein P5016_13530, partial [Verrucomicrobiales bacterium]|nr:hypothetical protein [Verrucomicrobiales bacterium]